MQAKSARRPRMEIAIAGCTDRELDVYRTWTARSYGDDVLLVDCPVQRDGTVTLPSMARIVIADLDAVSDATGGFLADRSGFIGIMSLPSDVNATPVFTRTDVPLMIKPLSRRKFKAALDPLIETVQAAGAVMVQNEDDTALDTLCGQSVAIKTLLAQAKRVARSNAPVFIAGETGTGIEACARVIHAHSTRANALFSALDCSTLIASDLDTALFGKGGLLEQTDGGTLFLNSIDALPMVLQAKVLRYLQTGSILNGNNSPPHCVDARLVCGTSADIGASVKAGCFRQDLYYHIYVLPLVIPPLRDRRQDIPLLARRFMDRANARQGRAFQMIAHEAEQALTNHDWPGNTCELASVIDQIVVLNDAPQITLAMLPQAICPAAGAIERAAAILPDDACRIGLALRNLESTSDGIAPLWMQEQRIIETALVACGGHVGKAAEALQISPSTIYRKMQSWTDRDTSDDPGLNDASGL